MQDSFRILIVDDDPAKLDHWESLINHPGQRTVYRAKSGYEALRQLVRNKIDCMVTDVAIPVENGPGMDGFELIRRIRRKQKYSGVYVLFIAGSDETMENIVQSLNDGGTDFLIDPVNDKLFSAKIAVFERMWRKREAIRKERIRSDELLRNILPASTISELKKTGKTTARRYDRVTILFVDFVRFTKISSQLKPERIVRYVNEFFTSFDEIIELYYLEKIKTIGDAYMAAGGVPIRSNFNAVFCVLAAILIREYVSQYRDSSADNIKWQVRIGLHTGPVVAGIVGKIKYQYDIWGDTVNTASRIEAQCEPGRLNISGHTYEYVKDYFDCNYRGKVYAKHKGLIEMYYVNRILPAFSEDVDGIYPNGIFKSILSLH